MEKGPRSSEEIYYLEPAEVRKLFTDFLSSHPNNLWRTPSPTDKILVTFGGTTPIVSDRTRVKVYRTEQK